MFPPHSCGGNRVKERSPLRGLWLLPELVQDVVVSALEQKRDATDGELMDALNDYMEYDAFMEF